MTWQQHDRTFLPGTQCLAFDSHAELLWTGGATGHVSSHFTGKEYSFSRYTAYRGHVPGPVQELAIDERGVLSVGGSVKLANRKGVALWNTHNEGNNISTACYSNPSSSEIVAGGTNIYGGIQPDLLCINAGSGTILRRLPSTSAVICVRRSNMLACGQADGRIVMRDPRSLKAEHTITAHTNGLSALEVQGNYLLSIGYTVRQGVPVIDPLVKVFDVRARRPLPPVSFPSIPAHVRPHPRNNSMVFVCSAQGHFQLADLGNPSFVEYYTVETNSFVNAVAVAPTGQGLAFADAEGIVDIWTAAPPGEQPVYARFPNPVEIPEPPEPPKLISWTPETPLSLIGMPYYDSQLFSYMPLSLYSSSYSPFGQPPKPIDPAVLATMKTVDFVGYAANPKLAKRNQAVAHGNKAREAKRKMDVPLFRSEKEREASNQRKQAHGSGSRLDQEAHDLQVKREAMPKHYRKVEIKYSKFGVEDFDFGFYNKTKFSGLETHIVNSYTNALLQALRFIRPIRELADGHIWTSCPRENCLLCEAGFLFKMLHDAKGVNCQASNFSKAFSSSHQANALGLMDIDDSASQVAYSSLIQICNRFLLETMNTESDRGIRNPEVRKSMAHTPNSLSPPALSQLLGLPVRTSSICNHCGYTSTRDGSTNVIDIVYPRKPLSNEVQIVTTFATILRASIAREAITKGSCQNCRMNANQRMKRELSGTHLPSVLAINTAVHTPEHVETWLDKQSNTGAQHFLQPRIAISSTGHRIISDPERTSADLTDMVVYELRALVVQIQAENDPAHLVSLVKVIDSKGSEAGWHVFNDFLVQPIPEEEALSFPGIWKIPAVLYYQRVDLNEVLDFEALAVRPDQSILTDDVSTSRNRKQSMIKHKVLQADEIPNRGTLVSIDAEFVSLQQEEVEYHSDGTKSLIRPSRMALARVSVIRGEGMSTGIPFIDDHIQVNEPIVDYLTEFSGIKPGDLDLKTSPHTLVPSKVAYKKLRLLVDLGCIFVGHGLNKDFRIINIFVPPSQILDTVNIYHLAHRHRKLSLRFLSWVVLQQDIQSSGSHDSIEDARTALQLYEKYCQLDAEGTWETTLEDIYREGGRLNWKVPGSDTSPIPTQRSAQHAQTSRAVQHDPLHANFKRLNV